MRYAAPDPSAEIKHVKGMFNFALRLAEWVFSASSGTGFLRENGGSGTRFSVFPLLIAELQ